MSGNKNTPDNLLQNISYLNDFKEKLKTKDLMNQQIGR